MCCSVPKSSPSLCDPMDCSMPVFPLLHCLLEFVQTHIHWDGDAIQPSHPLSFFLLLPSVFPSIRVFSNESALHTRWPNYWSFIFSISPSNEYSGWFPLLLTGCSMLDLELQHLNSCSMWDLVPWPGIEPLHWECGVLATGPPGRSPRAVL